MTNIFVNVVVQNQMALHIILAMCNGIDDIFWKLSIIFFIDNFWEFINNLWKIVDEFWKSSDNFLKIINNFHYSSIIKDLSIISKSY